MGRIYGLSLFSSSGIGDLALRANNIAVLVANELLHERAELFRLNYPDTYMIEGDIWEKQTEIISWTQEYLKNNELDFILVTPPCQGMSKNGKGKLLNEIRKGNRPNLDPRNRLIIPALNIIKFLKPKIIMFENVPEMENTFINVDENNLINIVDYIKKILPEEYNGLSEVVEFADYGVPQRRKRLITIFTRDDKLKKILKTKGSLLPEKTHSEGGNLWTERWVSIRDTIYDTPYLDSRIKETSKSSIPYHFVPVLDKKKYFWISNTPPEKGAFDNQCINKECMYQNNKTHGSMLDRNGINRAKTITPLYCEKCGNLLPRPYTIDRGEKRIMKGFTSAYRRMLWDKPANTITTNFSYPSSDSKLHPEQNRVLSYYEIFKLHTIDKYDYKWSNDKYHASNSLIRDSIGESVPPLALDKIIKYLLTLLN
jgi:DNA (cytosine-5)-methyltransferase 1